MNSLTDMVAGALGVVFVLALSALPWILIALVFKWVFSW